MPDVFSGLYRIVMEADKKPASRDDDEDTDNKDKDTKSDPEDPEKDPPKPTDYSIDDEEVEGGEKKDDTKGTEYGDGLKGDEPEPPAEDGNGSGGKDTVSIEDTPEDNPEENPAENSDETPDEGVDGEEGKGTDYSSLDDDPSDTAVGEDSGEDSPDPDSQEDNPEGDGEGEGEDDDKLKQYYLQVDFDRLQGFISNTIEKLTDVKRDSFIEKEVDAQCVTNYERLLQGIKDYILLKFDKNDYVTNRFNYSKFATTAKLNLELLKKINNSDNSGKQ